ncbi:MAG: hypothetical protein AAFR11_03940 [Pseudomonadota bacterium]
MKTLNTLLGAVSAGATLISAAGAQSAGAALHDFYTKKTYVKAGGLLVSTNSRDLELVNSPTPNANNQFGFFDNFFDLSSSFGFTAGVGRILGAAGPGLIRVEAELQRYTREGDAPRGDILVEETQTAFLGNVAYDIPFQTPTYWCDFLWCYAGEPAHFRATAGFGAGIAITDFETGVDRIFVDPVGPTTGETSNTAATYQFSLGLIRDFTSSVSFGVFYKYRDTLGMQELEVNNILLSDETVLYEFDATDTNSVEFSVAIAF